MITPMSGEECAGTFFTLFPRSERRVDQSRMYGIGVSKLCARHLC